MYLPWTFHVPRGMVLMTTSGQTGPRYPRSPDNQPVPRKGQFHALLNRRVKRALAPEHRAMNTRIYEGTNQARVVMAVGCYGARVGLTRATPDPDGGLCRRGDRPPIPTLLYELQR
jgi:hypothetical protein